MLNECFLIQVGIKTGVQLLHKKCVKCSTNSFRSLRYFFAKEEE
jgi:hypothetical protein